MTIDELLDGIENCKYAICFENEDEFDKFCEYAENVFGYSYRFDKEISLTEYAKDAWPKWTYIFMDDKRTNGKPTFNACSRDSYFAITGTKREIVRWSEVTKSITTGIEEETFIQILTGG